MATLFGIGPLNGFHHRLDPRVTLTTPWEPLTASGHGIGPIRLEG